MSLGTQRQRVAKVLGVEAGREDADAQQRENMHGRVWDPKDGRGV